MQLELNFEPDRNTGKNEGFLSLCHSQIVIESYSPKNVLMNQKHYKNPIGSGMPIVMRIIASTEGQYIININEGDDLFYYQNAYPHWSINRVEVYLFFIKIEFMLPCNLISFPILSRCFSTHFIIFEIKLEICP